MKTSRLAVPANPCAGSPRRAFASAFLLGMPLHAAAAAVLLATAFSNVVSAAAAPVNLAWNPNPESDVAGYQLSYGTSPGVYSGMIDAGSNTSVSVSGLTEGTTYYFVVTASNDAGLQSDCSAEISYQVPVVPGDPLEAIPHAGWTLMYVDSQELVGEDGAAANAIDGDPNTFWHSEWKSGTSVPPHEIQIDLGATREIHGFRYLPRQDGCMDGNIGQYEFYVSSNGSSWGGPVATGTFANSQTEKQVAFTATSGRYVRLRGLTDASGGIWCSIAELNILTTATGNRAPVASNGSVTVAEDTSVGVSLDASDPDGNPLSYAVASAPSHGALTGAPPDLTYTPAADFNGSDSFSFQAGDGVATSNTATISITVTPVNDPPVAVSISATTAEDMPVSIVFTASDKDSGSLSYTVAGGPAHGTLTGTPPSVSYTPDAGFSGSDSFTFRANDGAANSNTATVSITVTPLNHAPVAVSKSATTAEDMPAQVQLSANDADGDSLTYTIVNAPAKGTLSGTAPDLSYAPNPDSNGSDSFTFRANDGFANSNTATVSITVTPVNDAPVAVSKYATTMADTPVPVVLAASDKESGSLTFSIVSGPVHGVLTGYPPDLTYSPVTGFSGTDSFTYRAGDGAAFSNTATYSITVTESTPPPDIGPSFEQTLISMTVAEDTNISGQLVASDPDETGSLVFAKTSGPSWLSVSSSGALGGTPSNQNVGTNTFIVRVTDSSNASADASLVVTVTNTNDAPVFTINPIERPAATEEAPYDGGNIADTASDPDAGDSISFSKVAGPAWLVVSNSGGLSGTPPAGSAGLNTFTVRVTDKSGAFGNTVLLIPVASKDLPLPWEIEDLGRTGLPNRASCDAGCFHIEGAGLLAGAADSGCFVWQTLSGDGMITIRLDAPESGGTQSRVGVMIRDSLASNAQHVFMGLNGGGDLCWLRRTTTGGTTKSTMKSSGTTAGLWLRLVRKGRTVSSYKSANGFKWSRINSMTTMIGPHCYIGLSVASGSEVPVSATFSEVEVVP